MKFIKYRVLLLMPLFVASGLYGQQKISLREALSIALENNPELKSSALEVDKSAQGKVIARSLFLPSVFAGAQANHYFQLPAFFGFGTNTEEGKIPYGRFG